MHGTKNKQAQDIRIYDNLKRIQNVITVLSGKGGVGKSTVSVNLAHFLAMEGKNVGIIDLDIHGPNIPKMMGIDHKHFDGIENAIKPVNVGPRLSVASIALVGYDPSEALIWRGPMKIGLVRQFLGDIIWGNLDYLIIDTPPGTGDEALTSAQLIPQMKGVIIVTTPQELSILDSTKSITFAKRLNLPILGIIENMSGFICPHCGETSNIFSENGGKKAASHANIPFLGKIPIDSHIVQASDNGKPFLSTNPTQPTADSLRKIIANITTEIQKNTEAKLYEGKDPMDPRIEQLKNTTKTQQGFRPLQ